MSWIEFLSKLHLVTLKAEVDTTEEPSPEAGGEVRVTRTLRVSLEQLRMDAAPVPPEVFAGDDEDAERTALALLDFPWEKIYEAARLPAPEHDWTIDRALALRSSPTFRDVAPDRPRDVLLVQLAKAGANVAEILKDAQRRDNALDGFDRYVHNRVEEARAASRKTAEEAQARIRDLQKVVDREKADQARLDEALAAWARRKEERERAMAKMAELLSASEEGEDGA
ncbi:MAG: hypothetical protein ABIH26_03525 [Candidatus Eisenbacteria bacterium]